MKRDTRKKERKRERERERHIKYKKGDQRKGEREVKKAFFLMLFYFLLTPFLMHTTNIKKKFFSHIITRKILGELSPNCKNIQPDIGLAVRVFANGPGGLGSIPGRVIPKTQKMVLDASLLNTQHYKVRIKGKVEQSREGVAPSPTPWCCSYRKGSLRDTLDYGRQLYFYFCR